MAKPMTVNDHKQFDAFCKGVTWYKSCNDSWTAVYQTKYVCCSYAGGPGESRKKVQSEVLNGLYELVLSTCAAHNCPVLAEQK